MKRIKNRLSILLLVALSMCITLFANSKKIEGAQRIAAPNNIRVTEGNYYKYWEKHGKELKKNGKIHGDGNDAVISWDSVPGAKGYRVIVFWDEEGTIKKSVIDVKKDNHKYTFVAKSADNDRRMLAKSARDYIYNGTKKQITNKSLSFFQEACGSCVEVKKVKVRSYKLVNGKIVYSTYKTVYPKKY